MTYAKEAFEATEALKELDQAGLELYAPPPGWTLRITPENIATAELKAKVTEHRDRLIWWTIKKRYEPDALTQYFLDEIANAPDDMRERAERHRKEANKLLTLDELAAFQVSAVAYRSVMIAARTAAKAALPDGVPE